MPERDFPAIFFHADSASVSGQRWYKRLLRVDLYLVVIAAGLSTAASATGDPLARPLSILSVLLLASALGVEGLARYSRYERRWYGGRFIAESVKSMAWLYMMRAQPYDGDDATAESDFALAARQAIEPVLKSGHTGQEFSPDEIEITPEMRRVRRLSLDARKQTYLDRRVRDQIDWYSGKSNRSLQSAKLWFRVGFAARVLALASAAVYVVHPSGLQLTELFVAVAAAITAWTQLGRHEELSQSYAIAAQELIEIAQRLQMRTDEARFGEEVIGAEGSISREHKIWAAKRM